jgi:integrase
MSRTMLVRSVYDRFYLPLRLAGSSEHCRYQYRLNIARFSRWLGSRLKVPNPKYEATVDDFTDDNLAAFTGSLVTDGKSPATANKVGAQLRALWDFAARRGFTTVYPTWRKRPEYKRCPTAWSRAQLAALFAAVASVQGQISAVPAVIWWGCLLAVLWDTGLRIGAALKLEWSDLDISTGELTVRAETQKDKEDQRFKLHKDTLAVLERIGAKEGKIFRWELCYPALWYRYGKILKAAGLPCGRRDKFHRIRRSVASWFEAAGGNATDLLGHSDRRVTMRYLDPGVIGKPQASDKLFRPGDDRPAA